MEASCVFQRIELWRALLERWGIKLAIDSPWFLGISVAIVSNTHFHMDREDLD